MRYLGGKSRHARAIADVINPVRAGRVLWDPFCGGLASAAAFGGALICSDVHAGLIALYRAVQADPGMLDELETLEVTPALRAAAVRADASDPIATLIRLGTSFGGDLAKGGPVFEQWHERNQCTYSYFAQTVRSLRRQMRRLADAKFDAFDFLCVPAFHPGAPTVLYLDPPYPDASGYGSAFDYVSFTVRARAWARVTDVWVSGYSWPLAAGELVWEAPVGGKRGLPTAGLERLWKVLP